MYVFKLAQLLGKESPRKMLRNMEEGELDEWITFHAIEPMPDSWTQLSWLGVWLYQGKKSVTSRDFYPNMWNEMDPAKAFLAHYKAMGATVIVDPNLNKVCPMQ